MAQKRRIVPQLVSTSVSAASQAPEKQQEAFAPPKPVQNVTASLKEQSEYAAKCLGPGRHMYVELGPENTEVNWRRVSYRHSEDGSVSLQQSAHLSQVLG